MDFSDNFNRICKEKGTTPTALLKELGVSTNKVTRWNNGALPKEDMLIKLAHALGCSVMDFFRDESDNIQVGDTLILDDDERDVIRLFRLLSRKERHEFMVRCYAYEKQMMERE